MFARAMQSRKCPSRGALALVRRFEISLLNYLEDCSVFDTIQVDNFWACVVFVAFCCEVALKKYMELLVWSNSMRCSAFRFSHVCLSESLWRLSSPYSNMVKTFARSSTFARGRIVGKAEEGAKEADIRRTVKKTDGRIEAA